MFWFISWFIVGFIVALVVCADDLRGKPYDEDYFTKHNHRNCGWFACCVLFGYLSMVFSFFCWMAEKRLLTKLIYKIVNIGVKKKEGR